MLIDCNRKEATARPLQYNDGLHYTLFAALLAPPLSSILTTPDDFASMRGYIEKTRPLLALVESTTGYSLTM